jgi:hypothetical protein
MVKAGIHTGQALGVGSPDPARQAQPTATLRDLLTLVVSHTRLSRMISPNSVTPLLHTTTSARYRRTPARIQE